jgi:hypothetical protein
METPQETHEELAISNQTLVPTSGTVPSLIRKENRLIHVISVIRILFSLAFFISLEHVFFRCPFFLLLTFFQMSFLFVARGGKQKSGKFNVSEI